MDRSVATGTDLGRINHQIAVLELRVTQAVAKWVKRAGGHIHIPMVLTPSLLHPKDLRWLAVIVGRQLGGAPGNGNRKPATRIVVAQKYIRDSSATEVARFPRLDQRGNMSGLPTYRERPGIYEHNNHGCSGC